MALEIVLSETENSNCKSITFSDITGEDNLADSTKYSSGGSNTNIAIADIVVTDVFITDSDDNITHFEYDSDMPADGNPKVFTSIDLGQSVTSEVSLSNGVYNFDYYVWAATGTGNITITSGDNIITTSSDLTSYFSIGDYIRLENLPYIITDITSSEITLETNYEGADLTNSTTILIGYYKNLKSLIICAVKCCVINKIAKYSYTNCNCSKELAKITKYFMLYQGALLQFETLNYSEAQKTISYLNEICVSSNCGCK